MHCQWRANFFQNLGQSSIMVVSLFNGSKATLQLTDCCANLHLSLELLRRELFLDPAATQRNIQGTISAVFYPRLIRDEIPRGEFGVVLAC